MNIILVLTDDAEEAVHDRLARWMYDNNGSFSVIYGADTKSVVELVRSASLNELSVFDAREHKLYLGGDARGTEIVAYLGDDQWLVNTLGAVSTLSTTALSELLK